MFYILGAVPGLFGILGVAQLYQRRWGAGVGLLVGGVVGILATGMMLPPILAGLVLAVHGQPAFDEYGLGRVALFNVGTWIFYIVVWCGALTYGRPPKADAGRPPTAAPV